MLALGAHTGCSFLQESGARARPGAGLRAGRTPSCGNPRNSDLGVWAQIPESGLGGGSWERDSHARGRTAREPGAAWGAHTRWSAIPRPPARGSGFPGRRLAWGLELRHQLHKTKVEPRGPRCERTPGPCTEPGGWPSFLPPKPWGPGRNRKVVEDGPHRARLAWRTDPLNGCPFSHIRASAPNGQRTTFTPATR